MMRIPMAPRRFLALAVLSLIASFTNQSLRAATIGDPVIARPQFDGGTGQMFVYSGVFPTAGDTVVSWSFFSDTNASNNCSTGNASYTCAPGASITPVILSKTSPNTFVVTGIGATRLNALTGQQTFLFGLVAGTDVVGPNSTFGFRSGGPTDSGDFDFGVVDFDDSSSVGYFTFGERVPVIVGSTYIGSGLGRAYSIEFTTATPEVSTSATLGIGLIGLITARKLRPRIRVKHALTLDPS